MPAVTAEGLIQDALEDLGIYDPGDQVSAADAARSLFVLNAFIDKLSAESIYIYSLNTETLPIVTGTSSYTMGPGGDIDSYRPDRVTYGSNTASIVVSGATTPVNSVSAIEYQALAASAPLPGLPDTLWYNPTYPKGTLTVLPEPADDGVLTFQAWQRIITFATLQTSYSPAVGVLDGLRCNLAVELKPYFTSGNLDPGVAARAAGSREFMRIQGTGSRAMLNRYQLSQMSSAATRGGQ